MADVIVILQPSGVTKVTQDNQAQFNVIIPSGPPGSNGSSTIADNAITNAKLADNAVTNLEVAPTAAINADKLADGTTNKVLLATERTKLTNIATGATANSTDVTLLARANHTGTQSADTVVDGAANKVYLAAEKTKLAGVATGATANSSDATLLARVNHTGVAPIGAIPTKFSVDEVQSAAGVWPVTDAVATRRVNWIGYPGFSNPPAATGRPALVSLLDSYTLRT